MKRDTEAAEAADSADERGSADTERDLTPEERILELEAEVAEFQTLCLRAQADYKNLKRRSLVDLESGLQRHMQPLLEDLLLVLDFLDMALASPAKEPETKNLILGVQMTRTKFVQALEASNVQEIATEGAFDPSVHDATETRVDEDAAPGTILSTVRRGYTWQGRVLRPAQVVVAARADDGGDAPASYGTDDGIDEGNDGSRNEYDD